GKLKIQLESADRIEKLARLADHPSTAASVEGFQQFISAQFSDKHRIDEFSRHYRHRERRALQGSSKQMTMNVIADQVGGFYPNTSLVIDSYLNLKP
ncbi:hypothetical protein DFQ30_000407, partial [Apophysomyces sp. BC1015]